MYVNQWENVQRGIFILIHYRNGPINNDQVSHVQYVINNDGKIFDGKLLSKNKLPMMAE